MPQMMRAAVVREFGRPLVIEEMVVPRPGPGEVLVRIEATGVCHTDLHAAKGDWPVKPKPPFVPGHEGIGRVAALGAGVRNGAWRYRWPRGAAAVTMRSGTDGDRRRGWRRQHGGDIR